MIGTIVFCTLTQKGSCGMTVNNDIDDDSATKHGDSHKFLPRLVKTRQDDAQESTVRSVK